MTLETSDYLLIRSLLLKASSDRFIDEIEKRNKFEYIINTTLQLMQEEDFFLVFPEAQNKLYDLLAKLRFKYNKDKELNAKMNSIIEKLNIYKSMSEETKDRLIEEFYYSEYCKRSLTLSLRICDNIRVCISNDFRNYLELSFKVIEENGSIKGSIIELDNDTFPLYLSTINLLVNKFPYEYDIDAINVNVNNILTVLKANKRSLSFNNRAYLKNTLKTLKKQKLI